MLEDEVVTQELNKVECHIEHERHLMAELLENNFGDMLDRFLVDNITSKK